MSNHVPGMKFNIGIWVILLVIVASRSCWRFSTLRCGFFSFIYWDWPSSRLESACMFFMHLKYENSRLFWSLVPIVIFVLFMMNHVWPDAYRMARLSLLK